MKIGKSRRNFLNLAIKAPTAFILDGMLGGVKFPLFAGITAVPPPITLDLNDSAYAALKTVGKSVKLSDPNNSTRPMIVSRQSATKVVAFSSQCTFDGCELPLPVNGVLTCPCCGSQYDRNGKVIRGPATTDLTTYRAVLESATVIIVRFDNSAVLPSLGSFGAGAGIDVRKVRGMLRVEGPVDRQGFRAQLFDERGRLIRSGRSRGGIIEWDTRGISPGSYLVGISSGKADFATRHVAL